MCVCIYIYKIRGQICDICIYHKSIPFFSTPSPLLTKLTSCLTQTTAKQQQSPADSIFARPIHSLHILCQVLFPCLKFLSGFHMFLQWSLKAFRDLFISLILYYTPQVYYVLYTWVFFLFLRQDNLISDSGSLDLLFPPQELLLTCIIAWLASPWPNFNSNSTSSQKPYLTIFTILPSP